MTTDRIIIDKPAREQAQGLLEQYLNEQIDAHQVKENWPDSDVENTLNKLGQVIFPVLRSGKVSEEFSPGSQQNIRLVLDRCVLLLRSGRPYLWGDTSGLGCAAQFLFVSLCTLAWLVICPLFSGTNQMLITIFFVFILLAGMWILWTKRVSLQSLVEGDWKYWPFGSQADLEETLREAPLTQLPGTMPSPKE